MLHPRGLEDGKDREESEEWEQKTTRTPYRKSHEWLLSSIPTETTPP
jgi:hypothetical protein